MSEMAIHLQLEVFYMNFETYFRAQLLNFSPFFVENTRPRPLRSQKIFP